MPNNISYFQGLLQDSNIQAFLKVIRYAESDGNYNAIYKGFPPKAPFTFELIAGCQHPNILKPTEDGKKSSAAGAYQFTWTTWNGLKTKYSWLTDFYITNQDLAAVVNLYDSVGGENLISDIRGGRISKVFNGYPNLRSQWTSFNKMSEKTILENFQRYGGRLSAEDELGAMNNGINVSAPVTGVDISGYARNPLNSIYDFSKLATNIANQEADNTDKSWGNRNSEFEESDWIGLKQYLIYLTTRYYPHCLLPFVEIIPKFDTTNFDNEPSPTGTDTKSMTQDAANKATEDTKNAQLGDRLFDKTRYDRTAKQLKELLNTGGTDITLTDPFLEFTSSFNVPNERGKSLEAKRYLSYKAYGNLVMNPAVEADGLSKPGAIGLKSLTVETGSQVHDGMTLVTVKLLDIQGNKFTDINSPWSFILNSRPGMLGGDFLFRYGWQIRIPTFDPSNNFDKDPTAWKFWNHSGWNVFQAQAAPGSEGWDAGREIKTFISDLAKQADNTLTLTQNISEDSLRSPGFTPFIKEDGTPSYKIMRSLDSFSYFQLILNNPEINVNPDDGSVEVTLYFRTNSAMGNCLCPLNGAGLTLECKKLASDKNEFTLTELMTAFVNDNKKYSMLQPGLRQLEGSSQESRNNTRFFYADRTSIDNWVTLIGGVGLNSFDTISPDSIKMTISTDLKNMITQVTPKDNQLLISWVNKVLAENNMAMNATADASQGIKGVDSATQLDSGFIISYDSDALKNVPTKGQIQDATFGDLLTNYVKTDKNDKRWIGRRMFIQDDVFSFRFQGSLVESINIERLEAPNQAKILSLWAYGESQEQAGTETTKKDEQDKREDADKTKMQAGPTLVDKQRNLNTLYAQMLGLKVKMICHPWLKLARPCYVKGMGFWDGKYFVTKLVHELTEDGKFTTSLSACRVPSKNLYDAEAKKRLRDSIVAMNNPNINASELVYSAGGFDNSGMRSDFPPAQTGNTSFSRPGGLAYLNGGTGVTQIAGLRASLERFITLLHPYHQNDFRAFISEFETTYPNLKVDIQSGYRTFLRQYEIKYVTTDRSYNPKAAAPGKSAHNYGLAIDLNILDANNNRVLYNSLSSGSAWRNTGIVSIAAKYGLTWGGTFNGYYDPVHFGFDGRYDYNVLYYRALKQFGCVLNGAGDVISSLEYGKVNGAQLKFLG